MHAALDPLGVEGEPLIFLHECLTRNDAWRAYARDAGGEDRRQPLEAIMTWLRGLLLLEGASFIAASLVHRGILVHGYEHDRAAVAETVIGTVLLAATALAWLLPARTRAIGLGAQAFALLGTIVGL